MAFIRIKRINSLDYYYLVKSQWDPSKRSSTQHIIKYLGNAQNVTIEDIPEEYRHNPKILSLLAINSKLHQERSLHITELKKQIFAYLKKGDVNRIIEIADNFSKQSSLCEFYDLILKPVMYEIGSLWESNKLDISTEHVCSNIAMETIHLINGRGTRGSRHLKKGDKVLICTPDGEIHGLPCKILESVLLEQGFDVYNLSPSMPSSSLLNFIHETTPSIIFISVSFSENLGSALRLINKIFDHYQIPVLLGGSAINNLENDEITEIQKVNNSLVMIKNSTLDNVVKITKSLIRGIQPHKTQSLKAKIV